MWFLSQHKVRRTPTARSARNTFCPRLEALEDRYLLSAGALDTSFGSGGMVTSPISYASFITPVVVQPDGKILTGGEISSGKQGSKWALARYNTSGSLDSTFGQNGIVSTAPPKGGSPGIDGLALQSNGAIVAVGGVGTDVELNRYISSGVLDTTFGSGGIVLTAVVGPGAKTANDQAPAIVIYPHTGTSSDKIYVAGSCRTSYNGSYSMNFMLIRYNINGSLDTTFGSGGIVIAPHFAGNTNRVFALAIQPADGKIVLAGFADNSSGQQMMAIARYQPNGTLDTTFNAGGTLSPGIAGIVTIAPAGDYAWGSGIVVQSSQNNAIVVSGYSGFSGSSNSQLTLARLTSSGQLDTTFGGSGTGFVVNNSMTTGWSIVPDPNGDLLTNATSTSSNLAVAAYLPGGTPDTTFGTGGIATANFSGNWGGIAIQPSDGKIVAAGAGTNYVTLARFQPPDTKIGSFIASQTTAGGPVTLTASNILDSNPASTITQVAFYYLDSNNNAVLLSYGTLNTSTGAWSLATSSLASGTTYNLLALAIDSNGAISDPFTISFTVL